MSSYLGLPAKPGDYLLYLSFLVSINDSIQPVIPAGILHMFYKGDQDTEQKDNPEIAEKHDLDTQNTT
jgi:hypothetical protein